MVRRKFILSLWYNLVDLPHVFHSSNYIARAIENQCYVLAAAQYGRHNGKRESYGHSIGIDPWGKVLADAGGYGFDEMEPDETLETPTIVTCQIDINSIDSVRERMPLSIHRSSAKFSF
jgi:deaminated glutathione amidase